jgi:hypothetical protein
MIHGDTSSVALRSGPNDARSRLTRASSGRRFAPPLKRQVVRLNMKCSRDFAILAPVPARHLESGYEKLAKADLQYLAFGSGRIGENTRLRMLDFFRNVDAECGREPLITLIYPSREGVEERPPFQVCWVGWYVGHVPAGPDGLHPNADPWRYRPPTCRTNHDLDPQRERWLVYWHVEGLRALADGDRIDVRKLERDRPLRPWPLGPEIVRGESW